MRRIVSVWPPDWPVTVWSRTAGRSPPPEDAPFALIERGPRGLFLHALNAAARKVGLFAGQSHADARAAVPALVSVPAEHDRDDAALEALALWAERYSPLVAVERAAPGMEGLFIDMTGGAHLFGGEAALLADIRKRLADAGVPVRCAIADTPGAAWALARYSGAMEVVAPPGEARRVLENLPTAALRIALEAQGLLARLGMRRVGDLYGMPRAGLARRFRGDGLLVVERLDQALGAAGEALTPTRPSPRYRAVQVFFEPMMEPEGAFHWLPNLARDLCEELGRHGKGARRVRLVAFRVDGGTTAIEAALSAPSADPAHLIRLLKEIGVEKLDLGFGADALMLSAPVAQARALRQTDSLGETDLDASAALSGLVDRLSARLGRDAVLQPRFTESHIPERAERWTPLKRLDAVAEPAPYERPILMFDPPEPVEAIAELPDGAPARFTWRRVPRRVVKSAGPERLAPEWWRGEKERTRDYYRVEDETGRRYWLFREGLYGREDADAAPTWRMHGVFA
jgi:protein ImuB